MSIRLYDITDKRACGEYCTLFLFVFIHLFILLLMDLTSILNKVKSFPGVTGYVIVDKDCSIVHTSLEGNEAITLAAIVIKV